MKSRYLSRVHGHRRLSSSAQALVKLPSGLVRPSLLFEVRPSVCQKKFRSPWNSFVPWRVTML